MPGVSAEQVKLAKEIDLLTYLQQNEPHELRKSKHGDEHRTATHSSLVISNGLWFWNRGKVGGRTALDFLIKVRGMGFVDAVEAVLGARGAASYGAVDAADKTVLGTRGAASHGAVDCGAAGAVDYGTVDYSTAAYGAIDAVDYGTDSNSAADVVDYSTASYGTADARIGRGFDTHSDKRASDSFSAGRGLETSSAKRGSDSSCIERASDASSAGRGHDSSSALSSKESPKPPPKKWNFYPPRPERYSNKAVSYLQKRGISPDVINRAIQEGTLFESRYYNPKSSYHNTPVCVFAGKDESGKMVYAALRGIDTDFKIDKAGSDKRYNFTLPANNPGSRHLACFEAPMDLLSHATLQQRGGWDFDVHRLSLGGTSSVALLSFLERNPHIKRVMLHLDNDEAGWKAAEIIKAELLSDSRFKSIRVSYNPPRYGSKDYNDALLRVINAEREQRQHQKQHQKQHLKQQRIQPNRRAVPSR
jgi:hypothetical protein